MPNNVGSANVKITADDSQARKTTKGFFGFLKSTGKVAAGVAGGIAIFQGISRAVSGASSSTIGANASMEQYRNTLAVVLKDSEKAVKTLAWAEKFAAKTPFEIPDIMEATVRLESYGLKAQDVLETTGDMAAVMGKPLMQAVEAVADAQTGELERLKEFGITKDMLIKKSAEMGKSEVVNAKGQITDMEAFNEALFALMEDRYSGGMEIQSKTFNGLISNAKDSMGTIAREWSRPIFKKFKTGLERVVPVMSAVASMAKGDVKGAADTLTNAFGEDKASKIMGFFNSVKSGFDQFVQYAGMAKEGLEALFALFTGDTAKGSSLLLKLGLSPSMVQQIIAAINLIKQIINGFIQSTIARFQIMSQIVIQAWSVLWPFIQPLLQRIVSFVGEIVSQITQFWQENGAQIIAAAQNCFGFILTIVQAVMPAVMAIVNMVWTNIEGVIRGALNIIMGLIKVFAGLFTGDFSKMWEGVKQLFKGAVQFLWNFINLMMFGRILGGIKAFATKAISCFSSLWTKAVQIFKNLNNQVFAIIKSLVSKVISSIVKFATSVRNKFNTMRAFGQNIFSSLGQAIRSTISNMVSNVISRAQSLVTGLRYRFESILSKARSIFKKIKNAVMDPIRTAKDKVTGWISDIKSAFSNFTTKIKLPHFGISNASLNPKDWIKNGLPKLSVDWYAKGALFTRPTIFNTPGGLKGFGEAGPEAALPLTKKVLGAIGEKIAGLMSPTRGEGLRADIHNYFTPAESTPAESTKRQKKMLRDLALELD
ncbi:phage tail protein [Sediminibacillus terrae]|uniref:phage tail protein n=1 Tax=Sediminibacillus terrae TaxID=1562106 RepID=UPI001297208B|nr:tape measure protein [Sediminibacillus terrae]